MKKIIKLTESDLTGIVKQVINEIYSEKDMGIGEEKIDHHLHKSSRKTHNAFVQKIDDKIEFLLNGDYDNEPEYMEELYGAIVKLANTPTRKRAISYIKNKLI
jgi:hypothetical protein